jgi:hypothetical protein
MPMSFQAVANGHLVGFSPSNFVLYRLWERERYHSANGHFDTLLQSFLPDHTPDQSRQLAFEAFEEEEWNRRPRQGIDRNQFSLALERILKRGARWEALLRAVGSDEVLLVDEDRPLMDETTTLRAVIESGSDEEFNTVKDFLATGSNLGDVCLRLSGVRRMIRNLADTPREQAGVRSYLVNAITERIRQVFGEPELVQDAPLEETREFEGGALGFLIAHILGVQISFAEGKDIQTISHLHHRMIITRHILLSRC